MILTGDELARVHAQAVAEYPAECCGVLLVRDAPTGDRVLMLEDTVELQCTADDHVPLQTRRGLASMADLVRSALRHDLPKMLRALRSRAEAAQRKNP